MYLSHLQPTQKMKIYSTLFLLICSQIAYSQLLNNDTLQFIAYWEAGDSMIYEKNKYQFRENNKVIEKESNSNTIVRFDVLSQTDTNYILKYQIVSLQIDSSLQDQEDLSLYLAGMESIFSQLIYKIETTATGELVKVVNWEEIRTTLNTLINANIAMTGEPMSEEELVKMKATIGKLMDSEEKVQNMIQKEMGFLFSMYGYEYSTKDTIEYEQLLPNPFGGPPFPKYGDLYFEPLDTTSQTVKMTDISIVDKEAGKKAIIQILKNLMSEEEQKSQEMEEELTKVEFNISDRIELDLNVTNGVIEFGLYERMIDTNDLKQQNKRIDRTTFRLIKNK